MRLQFDFGKAPFDLFITEHATLLNHSIDDESSGGPHALVALQPLGHIMISFRTETNEVVGVVDAYADNHG
jgi:hypothetical protein